jgi:hypothetical protein
MAKKIKDKERDSIDFGKTRIGPLKSATIKELPFGNCKTLGGKWLKFLNRTVF